MAETQENQNRLTFAIIRHGLAKRFALTFLTLPGVGDSTNRLLFFFFLLAIACVSMFVSDGAAVAMAQLEALTGSGIGWFSWMMVGVPIFATLLVCNHFVPRFFFGPDVDRRKMRIDYFHHDGRALYPPITVAGHPWRGERRGCLSERCDFHLDGARFGDGHRLFMGRCHGRNGVRDWSDRAEIPDQGRHRGRDHHDRRSRHTALSSLRSCRPRRSVAYSGATTLTRHWTGGILWRGDTEPGAAAPAPVLSSVEPHRDSCIGSCAADRSARDSPRVPAFCPA